MRGSGHSLQTIMDNKVTGCYGQIHGRSSNTGFSFFYKKVSFILSLQYKG